MPSWIPSSRPYLSFGDRWGLTRGGNFREILDSVIPVSVVENITDDFDGSYNAISASTSVSFFSPNRVAACIFGNVDAPMLIHRLNFTITALNQGAAFYNEAVDLFVPFASYNPVVFDPVLFTAGGLNTNRPFTAGGGFALSGYANFSYIVAGSARGFRVFSQDILPDAGARDFRTFDATVSDVANPNRVAKLGHSIAFDPPLRIYSDRFLGVQVQHPPTGGATQSMNATILYTEQPNLRSS